jgi:FixJ family two-component response regulator
MHFQLLIAITSVGSACATVLYEPMTTCTVEEHRCEPMTDELLRILVSDDQPDVLEALRILLKGAGYKPEIVDSPHGLLRAAATGAFDLILMDLNYTRNTTSGHEGLNLLSRLHEQGNAAPVIVMTAWGNIDLAVEAMRRGASDFIQKPWDNARLLATVKKQASAASAPFRDGHRAERSTETLSAKRQAPAHD